MLTILYACRLDVVLFENENSYKHFAVFKTSYKYHENTL